MNAKGNKGSTLETTDTNRSNKAGNESSVLFIEPIGNDVPENSSSITEAAPSSASAEFTQRVEEIESITCELVSILDGAGVKIVEISASSIAEGKQLEKISDMARMEANSAKVMSRCSARIIARRVDNLEALDVLGLASASASWLAGITVAVVEIRKIARENKNGKSDTQN